MKTTYQVTGCLLRRPCATALLLWLLFSASLALGANKFVEQLVKWETGSNAADNRSAEPFLLEHFQFPARHLNFDIASHARSAISTMFLVEIDGEPHVRWIINPEDSRWNLELIKWFEQNGIRYTREKYFSAWYTASRSMIIEDPKTNQTYSAKVSTDKTGGQWRDKKQTIDDAQQVRMVSDYVERLSELVGFTHFRFLGEPAAFYAPGADQAMLVQSLGDTGAGKSYLLPGFSALHEQTGIEIATKNGAADPVAFWNEHYNKPLARALAEFAVVTGFTFDSPHSQNFLVELDADFKPKGIVIRDFGDSYALRQHFEHIAYPEFLQMWSKGNIRSTLDVAVGLLHGNKPPTWLSLDAYNQYGKEFFVEFERIMSEFTGADRQALAKVFTSFSPFSYITKDYLPPAELSNFQQQLHERLAIAAKAASGNGGAARPFERQTCDALSFHLPRTGT